MAGAVLYVSNVFTKVEGGQQALDAIRDALSFEVENAEIIKRKQYKRTGSRHWLDWDGRKSFFDGRSRAFMTGLLPTVTSALRTLDIPFAIREQRRPPRDMPADCSAGYVLCDKKAGQIELYDFQKEVCEALLAKKRGVAKVATGGGKTECAIAVTRALCVPTLFLTHQVGMLHQTAERLKERLPDSMEEMIGIIGDGIYDPRFITVATVQTLYSYMKKDKSQLSEELGPFRLLIIDEAHRSGAKQFHEVASLCTNAYFRLGLTATPFMAGNNESDMYLKGVTGNIITHVSNKELIERGLLAQPYFMFLNVRQPDNIGRLTDYREIYDHGITNNEYRNLLIANKLKSLDGKYRPLVIVNKLQHGENLLESMRCQGLNALFVNGSDANTQRIKAMKRLADGKIDAIIATNIFDEGIDVKEINCVVMAAGNKSAPAIFQRTGRTMRKKAEANHALIIDFIDMTHETLFGHSKERFDIVKKEAGFILLRESTERGLGNVA